MFDYIVLGAFFLPRKGTCTAGVRGRAGVEVGGAVFGA